jgi:SAM-dependent methyltransferase
MELVGGGGRAPELRRLLDGGPERESELAWLRTSLYADVEDSLARAAGDVRGRLLDLGAGTGDFLEYAIEQGWSAEGIEPSGLAAVRAQERGLQVVNTTLESFLANSPESEQAYDAVSMLNVLEHVPDPVAFLVDTRRLLRPSTGVVCLSVPNDFTDLQRAVNRRHNLGEWWIAVPDHLNYFDYQSLDRTLEGCGFRTAERTGTFPMEFLLLLGFDYVSDPKVGGEAHRRRISFEAALPHEVRRKLYQAMANAGFGRNCVVTARRID